MANDSIVKEAECNDVVINIPPELGPVVWPECCIYRVPRQLRQVKKAAYTPKLVSIGPFHHGLKELKDMEIHKLRYFKDFFKRKTVKKSQKELASIIEDKVQNIRRSYSDDRTLNSKDFVQMILLDAIFIIELFLKTSDQKVEDYISKTPCMANCIQRDLILLENQLPLFVLKELYTSGCCDSSGPSHQQEGQQITNDPSFFKLSSRYFSVYDLDKDSFEKAKHFTDLIRYSFCGNDESYGSNSIGERSLDTQICASKLDDAGLTFEAIGSKRLLGIHLAGCWDRFECFRTSYLIACFPICFIGLICVIYFPFWKCFKCLATIVAPDCLFACPIHILKVPPLVIDHNTEAIFRNLMALEQCLYPSQTHICSYVLLLDRLIDTEKDVNLLVDKGIIVNRLGSNAQVVPLINKLGHHIEITKSASPFHDIVQKLNDHYKYPLNRTMATLKREYFTNIFRGTATVVGLIVLGFTFWNFLRPFVV